MVHTTEKTNSAARSRTQLRGLDAAAVERSRAEHGENRLSQRRRRGFFSRFAANLGDPVIKVLLCALAANIIFTFRHTDWFETIGIAVSVLTATIISTVSEYGSEAAYERLSAEAQRAVCRVRRDGVITEISVADVVVGDIVLLGAGESVPADGFIVSGSVRLDQSAMTGESREVEKRPQSSKERKRGGTELTPDPSSPSSALRGCLVLSGEAEMLVSAVGDATYLGGISGEVQTETRESPLKVRLSHLAAQISRLGYAAAAIVAAAYLINAFVLDSGCIGSVILMKLRDTQYLFSKLIGALTLGLTVVVVAVPEGLPMMIAVVLSANIRRMVKAGVLVRKPVGIEAAGSMNILFTDKTGTLTEGRVSVGRIITGDGGSFNGAAELARSGGGLWQRYRESALLNTASAVGSDDSGAYCPVGGNAADRALLRSVIDCGEDCSGLPLPRVTAKQLFDSAKKYSACRTDANGGEIYIKGAPEILLPRIGSYIAPDGSRRMLDGHSFARELSAIRKGGGRVLLLAYGSADGAGEGLLPGNLTLIAAVALNDRLRAEARPAVGELRGAGIHVVMITGDSAETAGAIGQECGILGRGVDMVLESSELARLTDARLGELLPRIGVIARALPSDKSRLVRVAQEAGLVVGMTGDGINDAPALKRADIGFSMGGGTQVAKDAGDIVILDDNLASIAHAVLYGRNIFKSIRKFITLQLTMNFCAVGVSMIGPFVGVDAPVTVVQMLWINIIMDTLGGLAFAGEPALPSCMKEKPKRRDEPILNRYMVNQIVFLGVFTVALSLGFLKLPAFTRHFRAAPDNIYLLTAFFAFFIFAGVFNCFNARTDRLRLLAGIRKNPAFIAIMSAVLVIQIGLVYLGGTVLRTVPLHFSELMWAMAFSLLVFPAELLRKLLWRLRGRREGF